MSLTLKFQRFTDVVISTSMTYCEVNLLSNVEATLAQLSKFGVVVSMLRRRCEIDFAISTLQQRCHYNIKGILCIKRTI